MTVRGVVPNKKIAAAAVCLALLFAFCGCGKKPEAGTHAAIQIGETMYYNTFRAVPVEPDESAIVDAHPMENDEIKAYAVIDPGDADETVVGLIGGEWYKFLPKG